MATSSSTEIDDLVSARMNSVLSKINSPQSELIPPERPSSPPINLSYKSPYMRKKEIKPTTMKIGFLGLSKIGQAIVRNLNNCGHSLIIWDQNSEIPETVAKAFKVQIAETPAAVVRAAEITFSLMPDVDAAMELISEKYGILAEIESSKTVRKGYVEMTSLNPEISDYIGTVIKNRGGRYLEAPIFESRKEADKGTLFIQAAGDRKLYYDCKSCLDAISKKHTFVGTNVGDALKYHIVGNMLTGTIYAALAESMYWANGEGKAKDFLNTFEQSDMNSPVLLEKLTAMSKKDYTTDTSLKYMREQLNFGIALGNEVSQPTPVTVAAKEMYERSNAYKDHDVSAVFEGFKP